MVDLEKCIDHYLDFKHIYMQRRYKDTVEGSVLNTAACADRR